MEDLEFLKKILGGAYTIVQAALLINDENPLSTVHENQIDDGLKRQKYLTTVKALKTDIISRKLSADIFFDKSSKRQSGYLGLMKGEGIDLLAPRSNNITSATYKDIDENHTTIKEADLLKWLEDRNIRPPFFFPTEQKHTTALPSYMDPENNKLTYSKRLHAAVCAWIAVQDELDKVDFKKKFTPLTWMTKWVQDNFDMTESAAKKVATVANWVKQHQDRE